MYNHSRVIEEYAGERLDFIPWSKIGELVGIYRLHQLAISADNQNSKRVVNAAINKFNRQHKTRLDFESVRELSPKYGLEGLLCDPIIFTTNLSKFKEEASKVYDRVQERSCEHVLSHIDFDGIDTVLAYFPIDIQDDPRGYWILYKSNYCDPNYKLKNSYYSISTRCPIDVEVADHKQLSYSLPPEEEQSFTIERAMIADVASMYRKEDEPINYDPFT